MIVQVVNHMKPEKSNYCNVVNVICTGLLLGMFIFLFLFWKRIPEQVPAHFNAAGEVDRWSGKYSLFMVPAMTLLLYAFISLAERYPEVWNTGVRVTPGNRNFVYRVIRYLIVTTRLFMVATFTYITVNTALAQRLPGWFLPVDLILVFGSILFFIIWLYRGSRKRR